MAKRRHICSAQCRVWRCGRREDVLLTFELLCAFRATLMASYIGVISPAIDKEMIFALF